MSSDKDKSERPKSKIGGLGNMFRTLGRSSKKEKTPVSALPTGPMHGVVLAVPISALPDVPPMVRRCLDYLETDSVFRLENFSLQTPSLTEVNRLIKSFEDTDPELVNLTSESPDTVCGVLRKWLRSVPEPLFSFEFYEAWVALQHRTVNEDLFGDIQNLMFQLHPTHYLVMQRVFRFLHKLSSYGAVNRLTPAVLGFQWQPCLLWSQNAAAALDAMKVGPDGGMTGSIVTTIIENYDKLFLEDSMWMPPEFDHVLPPTTISNLTAQQVGSFGTAAATNTNSLYNSQPNEINPMTSSSASISRSDDDSIADNGFSSSSPSLSHAASFSASGYGQSPQTSGLQTPPSFASTPPQYPLPPIAIPQNNYSAQSAPNSMPVTPITPLIAPNSAQPLARSFAGVAPSSGSSSTTTVPSPHISRTSSSGSLGESMRRKQPIVVNGYIQATALCDFVDMSDGALPLFKNEQLYITNKHEDGWWEGWKRGRRGFFPAQYVVEMTI